MKLHLPMLKRILLCYLVLTPVVITLRILSYWLELDRETGFFFGNGTMTDVANLLCLAAFAAALVLSFSKKGAILVDQTPPPRSSSAPAILREEVEAPRPVKDRLPAFCLLGGLWHGVLSAFSTVLLGFSFFGFGIGVLYSPDLVSDTYHKLYLTLCILAGLYFFFALFYNRKKKEVFRSFFALTPALWGAWRLIMEYRDLNHHTVKSLYVGTFLFLVAATLFFTFYAQLLLGDEALGGGNAFAALAALTLFLGLACRVPDLVAMIGDRTAVGLKEATCILTDLAITLFAGVKLKGILQKN